LPGQALHYKFAGKDTGDRTGEAKMNYSTFLKAVPKKNYSAYLKAVPKINSAKLALWVALLAIVVVAGMAVLGGGH
jgi:hypothetical protein